MTFSITRRRLLTGFGVAHAALSLSGCDDVAQNSDIQSVLEMAERLTMRGQRPTCQGHAGERVFEPDISPVFKPNSSTAPDR